MMQKLWQKKLKLNYSKDILDIVQFGSSTIEGKTPNDVDVAVLFRNISLKEQLIQAQDIKKQLQKVSELPIHIKSFDLYSFFDKSNFAKDNILLYGISLIHHEPFSNKLGIIPKIQILYSLKDLKKRDKVRFNYMLSGKKGNYGLLKKYNGKLISPGIIEIEPEFEKIFTDSAKEITSNFKIRKVFYL